MKKFLLISLFFFVHPAYSMFKVAALKNRISSKKPQSSSVRSLFTATQRQQAKDFFKNAVKNPITLANVGATALCTYGVSKGIMNDSEIFALCSGIQGSLSFANAIKMYKADVRKELHKNNTFWQQFTVKNIQRNPNMALHKTFVVNHLHYLQKQKESFNICNESFDILKTANSFIAGIYFIAGLNQYNLEIIMLGSLGNMVNTFKLSSEHQKSIEIQNKTGEYLVETERAEEIIRKKLENEIKE